MFDQVFELQKVVSNRKEEFHSYKEYLQQGPFQWPDKWRLFIVGKLGCLDTQIGKLADKTQNWAYAYVFET